MVITGWILYRDTQQKWVVGAEPGFSTDKHCALDVTSPLTNFHKSAV